MMASRGLLLVTLAEPTQERIPLARFPTTLTSPMSAHLRGLRPQSSESGNRCHACCGPRLFRCRAIEDQAGSRDARGCSSRRLPPLSPTPSRCPIETCSSTRLLFLCAMDTARCSRSCHCHSPAYSCGLCVSYRPLLCASSDRCEPSSDCDHGLLLSMLNALSVDVTFSTFALCSCNAECFVPRFSCPRLLLLYTVVPLILNGTSPLNLCAECEPCEAPHVVEAA